MCNPAFWIAQQDEEIKDLLSENRVLRNLLIRVQVATGNCPTKLMQDIDAALRAEGEK